MSDDTINEWRTSADAMETAMAEGAPGPVIAHLVEEVHRVCYTLDLVAGVGPGWEKYDHLTGDAAAKAAWKEWKISRSGRNTKSANKTD